VVVVEQQQIVLTTTTRNQQRKTVVVRDSMTVTDNNEVVVPSMHLEEVEEDLPLPQIRVGVTTTMAEAATIRIGAPTAAEVADIAEEDVYR
jgi:hypothetical protein